MTSDTNFNALPSILQKHINKHKSVKDQFNLLTQSDKNQLVRQFNKKFPGSTLEKLLTTSLWFLLFGPAALLLTGGVGIVIYCVLAIFSGLVLYGRYKRLVRQEFHQTAANMLNIRTQDCPDRNVQKMLNKYPLFIPSYQAGGNQGNIDQAVKSVNQDKWTKVAMYAISFVTLGFWGIVLYCNKRKRKVENAVKDVLNSVNLSSNQSRFAQPNAARPNDGVRYINTQIGQQRNGFNN
jgi:hypothetical protein